MRAHAIAIVAAAFAATALAAPTVALAHQGDPNFRSELDGITPAAEGVEVEVVNYDDSLRLTNRSGETVVVEGYDGEPYLRVLGDGTVQVNQRSPSYYLNEDRYARVDVPSEADENAVPEWETVDHTGQYSWHDHRVHYMSEGTPPQVSDESKRTKVFDYEVPLTVGDRPAAIAGTLFWVGEDNGFPLAPFAALGGVLLGLIAFVVIRRRRDRDPKPPTAGAGEAW